jgi:hypothetical protein
VETQHVADISNEPVWNNAQLAVLYLLLTLVKLHRAHTAQYCTSGIFRSNTKRKIGPNDLNSQSHQYNMYRKKQLFTDFIEISYKAISRCETPASINS